MSRVGTAVTAILDPELLSQLDALCAASGMSRAEQIRALIAADYAEWRSLTEGRTTTAGGWLQRSLTSLQRDPNAARLREQGDAEPLLTIPSRVVACPQCRQRGWHKMDCTNKST